MESNTNKLMIEAYSKGMSGKAISEQEWCPYNSAGTVLNKLAGLGITIRKGKNYGELKATPEIVQKILFFHAKKHTPASWIARMDWCPINAKRVRAILKQHRVFRPFK